jgi:hypothetical protein
MPLDPNANILLSTFAKRARLQGWRRADIDAVVADAGSGDYFHLLATLMGHIEPLQERGRPRLSPGEVEQADDYSPGSLRNGDNSCVRPDTPEETPEQPPTDIGRRQKKVSMHLRRLHDFQESDRKASLLLWGFSLEAGKQGWSQAEIDAVLAEAKSGDYDHSLQTLLKYTEEPRRRAVG